MTDRDHPYPLLLTPFVLPGTGGAEHDGRVSRIKIELGMCRFGGFVMVRFSPAATRPMSGRAGLSRLATARPE